jgi:FixJ family two-component response regulator
MKHNNEGFFKQTFSLDSRTGRLRREDFGDVPLFDATRRFSCIYLSASAKDAAKLNHHLSAAGIRVYLARDNREAEMLLAITSARILLIDIDHMIEPWLELLQTLEELHPDVPKVVLTARNESAWSLILPQFAIDVVPKPVHLGDLWGALESAHSMVEEINDPERAKERIRQVLATIRAASPDQTSKQVRPRIERTIVPSTLSSWRSTQARLSAMMDRVTHVWWKLACHRTRKQHSHA